jgi:hypothetical protein
VIVGNHKIPSSLLQEAAALAATDTLVLVGSNCADANIEVLVEDNGGRSNVAGVGDW